MLHLQCSIFVESHVMNKAGTGAELGVSSDEHQETRGCMAMAHPPLHRLSFDTDFRVCIY